MKCYDLESNGSEIILFCLQTQYFFIFENLSALKRVCYITQRLVNKQHAIWNDILGERAETIQHSDSPLNTIFFSLMNLMLTIKRIESELLRNGIDLKLSSVLWNGIADQSCLKPLGISVASLCSTAALFPSAKGGKKV